MTLQLIDITVRDKQAHARLAGRVTGHVLAVLVDNVGHKEQTHDLVIPVWADRTEGMSDADVDMALLVKAADIVARLKASLNPVES